MIEHTNEYPGLLLALMRDAKATERQMEDERKARERAARQDNTVIERLNALRYSAAEIRGDKLILYGFELLPVVKSSELDYSLAIRATTRTRKWRAWKQANR